MSLLLILRGAAPPARNAALAVTEGSDTLSAGIAMWIAAALSGTESADVLAATATVTSSGDGVRVHTMLRLGRMMRH